MHLNAAFAAALLATGAAPGVSAQLNQLAQAAGKKYFGSAVDNSELSDQQLLKYLTNKNEFGQTTPGNGQKWQYTEPSRGQFSYGSGDQIADFAKKNGQLLRCHTLVWHSQLPSWGSFVPSLNLYLWASLAFVDILTIVNSQQRPVDQGHSHFGH